MSRVTLKSQVIVINQLTSQVAELTTQVGVLMNSLEASNQVRKDLEDHVEALADENEQLIALLDKPQVSTPAIKSAPKAVLAPAVVDASPVIEITDYDRDMWSKFKSLGRTTRLAIIEFARPEFGHVGIHNIAEVRAAWHSAQEISA